MIGNTAKVFPRHLDKAIPGLLVNSEDKGTVVRWAAAFALGEIVSLKTKRNSSLIPVIRSIIKREEKKSIQKLYESALRTAGH